MEIALYVFIGVMAVIQVCWIAYVVATYVWVALRWIGGAMGEVLGDLWG